MKSHRIPSSDYISVTVNFGLQFKRMKEFWSRLIPRSMHVASVVAAIALAACTPLGPDILPDAGPDALVDASVDARVDARTDAVTDAGLDSQGPVIDADGPLADGSVDASLLTDAPTPDAETFYPDAGSTANDAQVLVDAAVDAQRIVDAAPADAAAPDAAPADASPPDASPPDASIPDARVPDAAPPDAQPLPDAVPSPDAYVPECGDGIVTLGEQCDDGNGNNFDSCTNACLTPAGVARVDVDSSGNQSSAGTADAPSFLAISSDGQFIAFSSYASNLVAGDTAGHRDVFRRDTKNGATVRLSVDSSGNQGGNDSANPSISADGRYVAFESAAGNLATGDTNVKTDIFLRDVQAGTTVLVSVNSSGTVGNNDSFAPSISADGRFIVFQSSASNLVAGDNNGAFDIFMRDMQSGTTTLVSTSSNGTQGNANSLHPSISSDGRYVAFASTATTLVSGDTNGQSDIFVHDIQTGATTRVSVDSSGTQGNGSSDFPSISSGGLFVSFESTASNLIAGDNNGASDVFRRDVSAGITSLVSENRGGTIGNGGSSESSISSDGRFIAFLSLANNLVAGDGNSKADIFVRDTQTGLTSLVSVKADGTQGDNDCAETAMSSDGNVVTFWSTADNLVSGDSNQRVDVFRTQ